MIITTSHLSHTFNKYHEFIPPPRRGSHVKSDDTHTMIQHTPLSPYT